MLLRHGVVGCYQDPFRAEELRMSHQVVEKGIIKESMKT
jgi:hypothetical protein